MWVATAYAMTAAHDSLSREIGEIPLESWALSVVLSLIGGAAAAFQGLAGDGPGGRPVWIEIASVVMASFVAGLAAFFLCEWRHAPAPLAALAITVASWGGKRVLDALLEAGLKRVQGNQGNGQ
jgi:hypothetical protein